jgi:hypothetical protein
MGIQMTWDDAHKKLNLRLAPGSRLLAAGTKAIALQLGETKRSVTFEGKPVEVSF